MIYANTTLYTENYVAFKVFDFEMEKPCEGCPSNLYCFRKFKKMCYFEGDMISCFLDERNPGIMITFLLCYISTNILET